MVAPSLHVIEPSAWRTAAWGAGQGTTHELARWPAEGPGYAARLSVAEIVAPGPFTRLPGYARWLAVLDGGGGLVLTIAGQRWRGARGAAVRFDGADEVTAELAGPARVFNLIVRADVAWSASWIAQAEVREAPAGVTAIHAPAVLDLAIDGAAHALAAGATLIATSAQPFALALRAPAVLVHLDLDLAAPAPASRVVVTVDGAAMTTAAAMHAELARGFGFPAWYGHNLDALLDCLSSLDEPGMSTLALAPGATVTLAITAAAAMPASLYHALLDLIAAANDRVGATGPRLAVAATR